MAQYDGATQTRIETSFGNMLRLDREEESRIRRLYGVVTWGIFTSVDHAARKRRTAEFLRRLADYADQKVTEAP